MSTALVGPQTQRHPTVERRVKILLVDDTPENLVSLEAALDGLNQELVLAHSGKQALLQLLEHDFAAILLDVTFFSGKLTAWEWVGIALAVVAMCCIEVGRAKSHAQAAAQAQATDRLE